jgi:hypothetical protein
VLLAVAAIDLAAPLPEPARARRGRPVGDVRPVERRAEILPEIVGDADRLTRADRIDVEWVRRRDRDRRIEREVALRRTAIGGKALDAQRDRGGDFLLEGNDAGMAAGCGRRSVWLRPSPRLVTPGIRSDPDRCVPSCHFEYHRRCRHQPP